MTLTFKPRAILFDLDGTLVDSVPDIAIALNNTLIELRLAPAGIDQLRQWVGNGALKLVQRALAFAQSVTEDEVPAAQLRGAHQIFLVQYQRCNGANSRLYAGVEQALKLWQKQAIPMAVVTNKPIQFVPKLLRSLAIDQYFSLLVGGECLPEKKPSAMPLIHCCQQLGVAVEHCLMVGDSRNDIEAARAAGMLVAAVSYGYNHGESVALQQPDFLVDNLLDLLPA